MDTREATKQYRLQQWMQIIGECRSSGQTISKWCAENNINIKRYYYWLNRIRTAACESLADKTDDTAQLVPVSLSVDLSKNRAVTQQNTAHITIRLGAAILEISNGASTELITNTIKALTHAR